MLTQSSIKVLPCRQDDGQGGDIRVAQCPRVRWTETVRSVLPEPTTVPRAPSIRANKDPCANRGLVGRWCWGQVCSHSLQRVNYKDRMYFALWWPGKRGDFGEAVLDLKGLPPEANLGPGCCVVRAPHTSIMLLFGLRDFPASHPLPSNLSQRWQRCRPPGCDSKDGS